MAFDSTRLITSVHAKWGARGVQLLCCAYLLYRYSRAWFDGQWGALLTGGMAQGSVLGFEIPYEVVTALTPAIVFGMEFWSVLHDRSKGAQHSKLGFVLGTLVLIVANAYFWIAPNTERSVLATDGEIATTRLALLFSTGSLMGVVGMYLISRNPLAVPVQTDPR